MTLGLPRSSPKLALCLIAFAFSLSARINGPVAGVAGVPGEGDCTDCHTSTLNSGGGKLQIQLVDASTWTPGKEMRVRVTLTDPAARRWGFQLTARAAGNPTVSAGKFAVADASSTRLTPGLDDSQYVTQTTAGTRPGTTGSSSWEVLWTPPAASFGHVTFYAAGNAANGDGSNSGDQIYTTSLTASAAVNKPPVSHILPRLVSGAGWHTALYLHNPNEAESEATVNFFGAAGQPLDVAGAGVTSKLTLAGRGVALLPLPEAGPETNAWVEVLLPEGVTGYALLRRTVDGRLSETVLPLAASSSRESLMVFDQTSVTAQAVIVNPGPEELTLSFTARDHGGATIGTGTLPLAPKSTLTSLVHLLPGLEAINGVRGSLSISAAAPLAVSLLRMNGDVIAALPVLQR